MHQIETRNQLMGNALIFFSNQIFYDLSILLYFLVIVLSLNIDKVLQLYFLIIVAEDKLLW